MIDVGTSVISAKTELYRIDIDDENYIHHIKVHLSHYSESLIFVQNFNFHETLLSEILLNFLDIFLSKLQNILDYFNIGRSQFCRILGWKFEILHFLPILKIQNLSSNWVLKPICGKKGGFQQCVFRIFGKSLNSFTQPLTFFRLVMLNTLVFGLNNSNSTDFTGKIKWIMAVLRIQQVRFHILVVLEALYHED